MASLLYILIGILSAVALFLLYKYLKLRSELRKISDQLESLVEEDSEKMLDITFIDSELERLAGLFNRYNDKQRQIVASAMKDEEFLKDSVANISHDLRTPLTVILGHLQLLSRSELTKDQEERLDIIMNKAVRMKELVDTFYEYSLVTTSDTKLEPEKLNIHNMLTGLITENAPLMDKKGITPSIDLPEHSVYIISDKKAVERIFQNLITNAIRYSEGDISISLTEKKDKEISICISNPIPSDSQLDPGRMFDRFYTGDSSRNSGGTGLGLAVVKELTEKLGGTVSADIEDHILDIKVVLPVQAK